MLLLAAVVAPPLRTRCCKALGSWGALTEAWILTGSMLAT